jgi:hypothetical protein
MKNINEYIISAIDGESYGLQLETPSEKINFVYDTFKSEYAHQIKYYGGNEIKAFGEYLAGLPSCINIEFRNYYIVLIAKSLGSIPMDASEKQEEKIVSNWFNYVSNKFFQLKKKLK